MVCFTLGNIRNFWFYFIIGLIPWLNSDNIIIVIARLYFFRDDILFPSIHPNDLIDILTLTMWIYATQPHRKNPSQAYWTAERVFSGVGVAASGICLEYEGDVGDVIIGTFLKVMFVVNILRIFRKWWLV